MAFLGAFKKYVTKQYCLQYSDFKTLIFKFDNLSNLFTDTQNDVD